MKCKYCEDEAKGKFDLCEYHLKCKWKYRVGSDRKTYTGQQLSV